MGWVIAIIVAVVAGAFLLWSKSEDANLQQCKQKYGSSYVLGHSPVNSSIEWCQAPDGTVKAL